MARITITDPAKATGTNQEIFTHLQKVLGTVPNMTRVMANSPAVLQAYAQFSGALNGASLSAKVREQMALLVAEENDCAYCLSAHAAIGKMVGLTPTQIDAARLADAEDTHARAALRLARAVLETKGGVSDDDIRAARDAGLSEAALAEVVATVALNVFTNYINRAFAVDIDFPRLETHAHANTQ